MQQWVEMNHGSCSRRLGFSILGLQGEVDEGSLAGGTEAVSGPTGPWVESRLPPENLGLNPASLSLPASSKLGSPPLTNRQRRP